MDLQPLLRALRQSPFAEAIRESSWIFPTVETVHVLAITLVVGMIMMRDLRLLQVSSRNLAVTRLSAEVLPWTWGAFGLAVVTGLVMFTTNAIKYAANFPFQAKMVLLLLAGANMAVFHFLAYRTVHEWDESHARTPTAARVAGALSLLFWLGVVVFGRWIGFTI